MLKQVQHDGLLGAIAFHPIPVVGHAKGKVYLKDSAVALLDKRAPME